MSAVGSLTNSGSLKLESADGVDTFTIGFNTYAIVAALETWDEGATDGGVQILQLSTDDKLATKNTNVSLSESIALTDSITDEAKITLSESIALTDTITIGKDVTTALTESITLTDAMSKSQEVALSESILLFDADPTAPTNIVAKDHETDDENGFTMIENANAVNAFTIDGKTLSLIHI